MAGKEVGSEKVSHLDPMLSRKQTGSGASFTMTGHAAVDSASAIDDHLSKVSSNRLSAAEEEALFADVDALDPESMIESSAAPMRAAHGRRRASSSIFCPSACARASSHASLRQTSLCAHRNAGCTRRDSFTNIDFNGATAQAMGEYYFYPADGSAPAKVEYTFGYKRNDDGKMRIYLHHSSLPYNPK